MTAMISLLYNIVYTGSAAAALPMLVYYFLPYAATNALLFFGTAINIAIQLQNFDAWYHGRTYADFPFWVPHLICIAFNVAADRRNARREGMPRTYGEYVGPSIVSCLLAIYQLFRSVLLRLLMLQLSIYNVVLVLVVLGVMSGVLYYAFVPMIDFGSRVYFCLVARKFSYWRWEVVENSIDVNETGPLEPEPETDGPGWKAGIALAYLVLELHLLYFYEISI